MEAKWQGKIEEREKPLPSLTGGCGSLLIAIADRCLLLSMKTVASGTLKGFQRRRGLSLLRDIGLRRSALYLGVNRWKGGLRPKFGDLAGLKEVSRPYQPELGLSGLNASSSASVDNKDVKSSTPLEKLGAGDLVLSPAGQNILTSVVSEVR